MTEQEFTNQLIALVRPSLVGAKVDTGMNVLYEMQVDEDGKVRMGVDKDTGEPLHGRGTGFEQDILIYEETTDSQTSVIPRVIAEVKYGGVTTHDAIVYSYKAECIKRIYPFCRYGMILGGFTTIPGRVLRHGRHFDFVCAMRSPLVDSELEDLKALLISELASSRQSAAMLKGKAKVRVFHRGLTARK